MSEPVYDPEAAAAQGFSGFDVDQTPNENYSLQTPPDAPTPETDPATKKAAIDQRNKLRDALSGKEEQTATSTTSSAPKSSSKTSGS